ncbi:Retrovirus-related Pol polyprotein from transposon RE2 [Sesamum angolense]|uniref:Retrovirus-related Pol polyprotein from transposon RE2 n=1 Tax=Sesamum angolense TaxID=2727404 RepID=A0AAE1X387_9LAMI|nr:Retrovirus-related Pol polyprotein from transposon RE2 [Sesamum angolense]
MVILMKKSTWILLKDTMSAQGSNTTFLVLLVYLDDVLITGSSLPLITERILHFLGGALISWKTKKQATVSRSSAEAEYRSMGTTVCKLQRISYLLRDFQLFVSVPIPLFCDNKAAIHNTGNLVFHERTCHVVQNQYKYGFILLSSVCNIA